MEKVSIIIPAYNEEKRIGNTLAAYGKFFSGLKKSKKLNYEILVVINNTKDKTEEVVKKYQKINKNIRYVNFKQGGKGFAIIEGFKDALTRKENTLIGFVDGDMATPPEAFYDLVKNIGGFDGVIASRWLKNSVVKTKQSFLRRTLSRGFNFIVRSMFLMPYRDTQCGAKLLKKRALLMILPQLNLTQWAFDVNLLYICQKKGILIKEIPTIWEDKTDSKLDITKTPIQMFSGVLRLRLINSIFEPLLRPIKGILRLADRIINK